MKAVAAKPGCWGAQPPMRKVKGHKECSAHQYLLNSSGMYYHFP